MATSPAMTVFALIGRTNTSLGDIFVYPQPFDPSKGPSAVFTNIAQAASVTLYTATGEKVRSLGVVTKNATNQSKSVQQSVGTSFVEFKLAPFQSITKTFPTPASGSAKLTVYFDGGSCGTSFDVSKSTGIVTISSGTCSASVY